jgi:hypothetical protein
VVKVPAMPHVLDVESRDRKRECAGSDLGQLQRSWLPKPVRFRSKEDAVAEFSKAPDRDLAKQVPESRVVQRTALEVARVGQENTNRSVNFVLWKSSREVPRHGFGDDLVHIKVREVRADWPRETFREFPAEQNVVVRRTSLELGTLFTESVDYCKIGNLLWSFEPPREQMH